MSEYADKKVVIIGGGPAGLTAAYQLCRAAVPSVVLEKDRTVGGLSRTVNYKGCLFDIGGHRFFTKVKAVDDLWRSVLSPDEFQRRPRLSRIYYDKRFYYYPLRAIDALSNLGIWNACLIVASYVKARLFPEKSEKTFDKWVTNRFGKRLYRMFFKTYTEKVWGIPCEEIASEWAAQRITGLSLASAIKNALFGPRASEKSAAIKTLTDEFDYPTRGPGMMWERMAELVKQMGGEVCSGTGVEKIIWSAGKIEAADVSINNFANNVCTKQPHKERILGTHFISSMPVRELIRKLNPPAPSRVLKAANNLKYRDFLTVALIVDRANVFPDNWIYVHDPTVRLGRIQNFKNWSAVMVPDTAKTCLGLEYFCFEGDGLWTMTNRELIDLGTKELEKLGLVRAEEIEDGTVVRVPKAYPIYDSDYQESLQIIRHFLEQFGNLQLVGRNGMHKYNNQDHSMFTAILAVENILGADHDLWEINTDQEYHENAGLEESKTSRHYADLASTQPKIPKRI